LKVSEAVQVEPAARVIGAAGQVVVPEKDVEPVPDNPMLLIVTGSAPLPVLYTVTVWAALAVPTAGLVKVSVVGDKVTAWAETWAAHPFTRLYALTEPRPVARSYPVVEL
jgi:hypothetical protein